MSYSLRVADLPVGDRPREKLLSQGARYLSSAELLAILLGTGQGAGKLSAVGLGQFILKQLGERSGNSTDAVSLLRDITPEELMAIPGVGPAKATTILAAVELGKRVFQSRPGEQTIIDNPALAAAVLSTDLMWQPTERFAVLLLDVRHRLLGSHVITVGTATETLVHPREVFREAVRRNASRLIIAHNHPSGSLAPSQADLDLTKQILQAGQIMGIPVLDHLILGNGDYQSLRETTSLWQEVPQGDGAA
ncbi:MULTISPECIES: DNA repair protein RadC [unclassified Thermosynechococcus]|uniref:RadC family protein n=1 Tax=unclassified Thermosynechococcus TaxID=2622553 RepID=UPI002671CAF3|nr:MULTISPECIES: DNA repair protein RadC [unclassified Thermosynechococcus]MDR5639858.1 DNA repair protein RadC [Thermosynechococcus sp. PP42]MDR7897631.1 DNA repair protein RadC [Thermosynechococcus sp. JY1332]MDR7905029.1 DNA repair protein RadC [Thermosynechococcus sp. JY1334]MDR7992856.1 DNA repair protein RadC [Thermosynechococcus sp. TG252]WKT87252.1 DNA repair protein RadC [Thermosynechococcus sp. JY1339]